MTQENWLPVPGYEGIYEVSDVGRVRSLDRLIHRSTGAVERHRGRILVQHKAGPGYLFVALCRDGGRKLAYVHRLVAAVFLPASEKPHVNHKDFDKENNAASNLEWTTSRENSRHRVFATPHVSAADASATMQAVYEARATAPRRIKPAGYHPTVKQCAVCGKSFAPRPTSRERQKTCSRDCGNTLAWTTRRLSSANA